MKKRISVLLAAAVMCICANLTAVAAVNPSFELEDVTNNSPGLKGESKIQVTLNGVDETLSAIQVSLDYESDTMKYQSIEWGDFSANSIKIPPTDNNGALMFSVNDYDDGITPYDGFVVCTLTFMSDNPQTGGNVNVTLDNAGDSYVLTEAHRGEGKLGDKVTAQNSSSVSASARNEGEDGVSAEISLVFDSVSGFGTDGGSSGINIELTNDATGASNSWRLDKSADRDTTQSAPTFRFKANNLVSGSYTLTVTGEGYVPVEKSISLSGSEKIEITNDEFIPGDINSDGKIDLADYNLVMSYVKNGRIAYTTNCFDFNRDGGVNAYDVKAIVSVLEKEAE